MEQLKSQVKNSFIKLKNAIDLREKLLLRQIQVFSDNSATEINNIDLTEISFHVPKEAEVLMLLRNYGNLESINLPFLENENEDEIQNFYEKRISADYVADNKNLSESIVNLTLKESNDLIKKSSELVSTVSGKLKIALPIKVANIDKAISIKQTAKANNSDGKLKRNNLTTSSKKKTLKNISNLTMNNSGAGNIILKNISNLTITTCKPPIFSENKSSACNTNTMCDAFYPQCDFYEKLISENEVLKKTIVNQSLTYTTYPDPISAVFMSPTEVSGKEDEQDATYSINSNTSASLNTFDDPHELPPTCNPTAKSEICQATEEISIRQMQSTNSFIMNNPPIQCWLSKMYLETETEPTNNVEILEYSNIV